VLYVCAMLRAAGILVVVLLIVFPLVGGMTPIQDDWNYYTPVIGGASLAQAAAEKWHGDFFRPIDILGAALIDRDTLSGRNYVPFLAAGFLLLVLVLRAGVGRLARSVRLPSDAATFYWLTLAALMLHPSTAVSLWQMDTASQVWSAAAGVAFGLAIWKWHDALLAGRASAGWIVAIVLLELGGMLTKETFLGWCASLALVLLVLAVRAWRGARPRDARACIALAATILVVCVAWVEARARLGGLALGYGKYSGNLVVNAARNTVLTLVGGLAFGPIHVMRDPAALPVAKAAVVVGLVAAIVLAVFGVRALWRMETTRRGDGATLALVILACMASISAGMPTMHISEVYLLGPNVGFALLLALGVSAIGRAGGRGLRSIAVVAVALLAVVGVLGLASRMQQFAITWQDARTLHRESVNSVRVVPDGPPVVVALTGAFAAGGYVHSTYVVPPSWTMPPLCLELWLRHRFPSRRLRVGTADGAQPGETVVRVSGASLPARPHD